jgi:hypothetical protein
MSRPTIRRLANLRSKPLLCWPPRNIRNPAPV